MCFEHICASFASVVQASNSDRDSTGTDTGDCDSTPTTPSGNMVTTPTASVSSASSQPVIAPIVLKQERVRPHTISVSSEKTHTSRPALKPELFEPLPEKADQGEVDMRDQSQAHAGGKIRPHSTASSGPYARPAATINKMQPVLPPHCPRPKIKAVPPPSLPPGWCQNTFWGQGLRHSNNHSNFIFISSFYP